jgi:hypothetical protein
MTDLSDNITPWGHACIRIMKNGDKGIGVRLTADEVMYATLDDAISTYATLCQAELDGKANPFIPGNE